MRPHGNAVSTNIVRSSIWGFRMMNWVSTSKRGEEVSGQLGNVLAKPDPVAAVTCPIYGSGVTVGILICRALEKHFRAGNTAPAVDDGHHDATPVYWHSRTVLNVQDTVVHEADTVVFADSVASEIRHVVSVCFIDNKEYLRQVIAQRRSAAATWSLSRLPD